MKFCTRVGLLLLLLAAILLCTACGYEPVFKPYLAGECAHSFSDTWFAVTPDEGEAVTKEVHYCRICHKAEERLIVDYTES